MNERLAIDDLMGQAREGWRLGAALCTDCGGYHQVRGALRAMKVIRGPDTDEVPLRGLLNDLVRPGHRVLIAGAGDPGQLQSFAELTTARPVSLTIVDRCPAPLAVIDLITPPPGLSVTTQVVDLTQLSPTPTYDLILSHSMLPFLPEPDRVTMLQRFAAALAPSGRLLITVPIVPPKTGEERQAYNAERLNWVRDKFAAAPAVRALLGTDYDAVVTHYEASRSSRTAVFTDLQQVVGLIEQGGFVIERHIVGGESPGSTELGFGRRGHIFLAAPV